MLGKASAPGAPGRRRVLSKLQPLMLVVIVVGAVLLGADFIWGGQNSSAGLLDKISLCDGTPLQRLNETLTKELSAARAQLEDAEQKAKEAEDKVAALQREEATATKVDLSAPLNVQKNTIVPLNPGLAARWTRLDGIELMIMAPTNDEFVGSSILASGQPFDPSNLRLFLGHIKEGSTVVDAGCNLGSYSIFFAAKTGPMGQVHCFEPQKKMAYIASANSVINDLSSRMIVHNNALSFAPGHVEMNAKLPDGVNHGTNMTEAEKTKARINYGGMNLGRGGESVEAVTLDSLNLNNVSFIKIDVQGAEPLMLYGARETIRRNLPVVIYEYTPNEFVVTKDMIETMKIPKEVLDWNPPDYFKSLGYTVHQIASGGGEVAMIPPPPGAAPPDASAATADSPAASPDASAPPAAEASPAASAEASPAAAAEASPTAAQAAPAHRRSLRGFGGWRLSLV